MGATLLASAQTDSLSKSIQKRSEAIGHGGNNEIKINLLMTVIGIPEITYERLIGDNMGLGISGSVALEDNVDYRFAVTPHYRLYFGTKKANGFFIEGNMALIGTRENIYFVSESSYYSGGFYGRSGKTHTNFGLGAAAGAKFLTRNGFLGEAYLGVGRIMGERRYIREYPRIGITIGKRF
ncbi:hypothetical protein AQF98_10865 [Pedobacter sp. Hv1]|nr:hypothetical protein AQF98_10865 [Pedobacter sp. Hv1]